MKGNSSWLFSSKKQHKNIPQKKTKKIKVKIREKGREAEDLNKQNEEQNNHYRQTTDRENKTLKTLLMTGDQRK